MSKDTIKVDGEEVVVREDTAKAYRGVNWALISIGAFILILGAVFAFFFIGAASDGDLQTPKQAANTTNTNSRQ